MLVRKQQEVLLTGMINKTLGLTNSTVYWKTIAPKPVTNQYSVVRNGYGDGLHVAVVDDTGSVTGIQGNILEKHTGLSKCRFYFFCKFNRKSGIRTI